MAFLSSPSRQLDAVRLLGRLLLLLTIPGCGKGDGAGSPSDGAGPPMGCGNLTCGAGQICVHPACCPGGGLTCHPLPDSGTCPADTDPVTCPVEAKPGCMDKPCARPAPFCMDPPGSCAGNASCNCLSSACAPYQCSFFDSQKRSVECTCP